MAKGLNEMLQTDDEKGIIGLYKSPYLLTYKWEWKELIKCANASL